MQNSRSPVVKPDPVSASQTPMLRADSPIAKIRIPTPIRVRSNWPIRTYQTQRPPARTVPGRSDNEGICVNSIVSGGTVIAGGGVNHSVLGTRVYIDDGATVEDSILFSDARVGEGAQVRHCICDRYVAIPPGEQIGFDAKADRARFPVTDNGVVVIPSDFRFDQDG